MNDRMTVAAHSSWTDTQPPVGVKVWVWYFNQQIKATYNVYPHNGGEWHDENGAALPGVTHWKPIHP